jgi:hypothetical protein
VVENLLNTHKAPGPIIRERKKKRKKEKKYTISVNLKKIYNLQVYCMGSFNKNN